MAAPPRLSASTKGALASLKARRAGAGAAAPAAAVAAAAMPGPRPGRRREAAEGPGEEEGVEEIENVGDGGSVCLPTAQQPRYKDTVVWQCQNCLTECVKVGPESRCLCGHRLKQHHPPGDGKGALSCKDPRCKCKCFFYLVAEGSWMLRCECKHKGVEHDPVTRRCKKPNCKKCPAGGFRSPWVCNCDCPWSDHRQMVVQKRVLTVEEMILQQAVNPDVNNYGALKRGLK